jgi:hypothetical protein
VQVGRRHIPSSAVFAAVVVIAGSIFWAVPGGRPTRAEAQDLAGAFARATEAIRRDQTPEGYWTTPVTPGPVFDTPASEVNVFTPAVIIDLVDPVASEAGLTDVLARGREYLRRQIEKNGLVRYHGDAGPVPPAIRGCELPPDADDTALLWRIAPVPDRALLAAARREIDRYRDDDGLYRTWLADETLYRCFYVRYAGREWNPPDVAVEMHVYMFLADHDPPAAERLCHALRRRMDDDRVWVWYTVAPFVPLLREVDLARSGCPLQVPQSRLERAVAGQDRYLTQGRLLRRLILDEPGTGDRSSPEPYLRALREGAAEGFASIRQTPPLIYHNDLSATPPHFHWSADVGYALWLRLYVETARRFPGALAVPRGASSAR